MNAIETIMQWNKDAGNTAGEINVRQSALYLGLQCEELAEKLNAVGFMALAQILDKAATNFKTGEYDYAVKNCLATKEGRKEMLDGDLDLIVVSVGAAMSQGAQVHAAMAEVLASNDSKRTDGKLLKDANGKITKGPNYFIADLLKYVKDDPEQPAQQGAV